MGGEARVSPALVRFACKAEAIEADWTGLLQGVMYQGGDRVQQNCNECTCVGQGTSGQWQCERNACMIQADLLDGVNGGRFSWTGRNYSRFWGKTLDFGIRFRLGTLFPERSVQNMNEILIKVFPARPSWREFGSALSPEVGPVSEQSDVSYAVLFQKVHLTCKSLGGQ